MGLLLTSTSQGPWAGSTGRRRAKEELQPETPVASSGASVGLSASGGLQTLAGGGERKKNVSSRFRAPV